MTQLMTEQGMVRVPAGTWVVDPAHSSVAFEVKRMMTATVRCHFSSFDGTYRVRSDLTIWDETREVEVEATVQGAGEDP